MRRPLSRSHRRFIPTFEILEERNPASLLWLDAAGVSGGRLAPTRLSPALASQWPDQTMRSPQRGDGELFADLTPTQDLSLLPPGSGGSASEPLSEPAAQASAFRSDPHPVPGTLADDPFAFPWEAFAGIGSKQSGGGGVSSVGPAGSAGPVFASGGAAAPFGGGGMSSAPLATGSGAQMSNALLTALASINNAAAQHAASAKPAAPATPIKAAVSAHPKKQADPLFVIDANKAIVLQQGLTNQEFSTWTVDLRAQVSAGTVATYSWNLTSAPDATSISGLGTYRLQFTWASFTGAARTDTITLTTTNTNNTQQTLTLTFVVTATDSPAWTSSAPTSSSTWPTVVTPDMMTASQQTADSQNYSLGLATGEVTTAHSLPTFDPGVAPLGLVYSSLAANQKPIFLTRFTIDPTRSVPPTVSAQLTLNGTAGSTFYYNTSALNPGDILEIAR